MKLIASNWFNISIESDRRLKEASPDASRLDPLEAFESAALERVPEDELQAFFLSSQLLPLSAPGALSHRLGDGMLFAPRG